MKLITIVIAGVLAGAAASSLAHGQIKYQTPSPDLVRILEAPSTPVPMISPNRKWILVTSSDPRTITIRDMAEPAYYLAGAKVPANPDAKIANVGIVSGSGTNLGGSLTRTLPAPAGGRAGNGTRAR